MKRLLYAVLLGALFTGCATPEVRLAHDHTAHVCHDDCHGFYDMTPEEYRLAVDSFEQGLLVR